MNKLRKMMIVALSLAIVCMTGALMTSCSDSGESNSESASESAKGNANAFTAQTVFHLDTADVPTFGAFIAAGTITCETDGTFTNNYDFTPAGAVAGGTVFPSYDGEYKLSEDKKTITFIEPWKGTGNQSFTEETYDAGKIIDVECEIETLSDGSYKFVRIFNTTLKMPYYSNQEQFDSLKEFEYPAELGEKIVFDAAENFVADVKSVAESESLGQLNEFTLEFLDDGSFSQSLTIIGSDDKSFTMQSEGGYKLDKKDNPTKITLLITGETEKKEYVMAKVEDYYTITYVSESFGNVTLYSDIEKIPSSDELSKDYPSDLLGAFIGFDKITVFNADAGTYGAATFTFNKDGSAKINVMGMDFTVYYCLNAEKTSVIVVDGGNASEPYAITLNADNKMQFTYQSAVGALLFTEKAD